MLSREVGLVVTLQKGGKAFKGLCPFHNERTPSFYVFAETQTWHCFGCNDGGDIFTFVQKQQGLDFREAATLPGREKRVFRLRMKVGVTRRSLREAGAAKERLRKLNEDALLWFHQMLLRSKEATEARTYVQSREFHQKPCWPLGWATLQSAGMLFLAICWSGLHGA